MCSMRTIIATVLSVLFLIPLSAQERRGLPINNAPTAAFDLGWLAKYYGTDWSVILAKLQADAMNGRTPAGKSVKKSAGQTGIYDKDDYNLSLRTNLLHWAMLTRNIGVEWRISPGMGLMINGAARSRPGAMPCGKCLLSSAGIWEAPEDGISVSWGRQGSSTTSSTVPESRARFSEADFPWDTSSSSPMPFPWISAWDSAICWPIMRNMMS